MPTAECVAALASILQRSLSAGGCSACSANITKLVDGDTGAVLYSRTLAAVPSSLAVTYSVIGPSTQLAAVTSSPSSAFKSAVTAAIANTPGYTTITSNLSTASSSSSSSSSNTLAIGLGVGLGGGLLLGLAVYAYCAMSRKGKPAVVTTKGPVESGTVV